MYALSPNLNINLIRIPNARRLSFSFGRALQARFWLPYTCFDVMG